MTPPSPANGPAPAEDRPANERPTTTPQTDPTNPVTQEGAGEWTQAMRDPERKEGVHSAPESK